MRSFFFLAAAIKACTAQCGQGAVDLSGVKPFQVSINCPGNKNEAGIDMGCVNNKTKGFNKEYQTQKSNIFYINPCGEADPNEPKCKNLESPFQGSAAFEVTKDFTDFHGSIATTCYSIGLSAQRKFMLLDEDNPDGGLKAVYTGGTADNCPGKSRELEVNFHCSTQGNEMYNDVEEPDESPCSYVLHYNTIHACPKYCVTGDTICNGKGVCGHDNEPCLCNEGYMGTHCETAGYPPSTPPEIFNIAAALLTIAVFLLSGLLAFLVYMWVKLRRLAPVDTEAYSTLSSKFNELGQIT